MPCRIRSPSRLGWSSTFLLQRISFRRTQGAELASFKDTFRVETAIRPTQEEANDFERVISCGTFKYMQPGTPHGGHRRRSKGVLMAVRSCMIIIGYDECFGTLLWLSVLQV